MTVTQRGQLSPYDRDRLLNAQTEADDLTAFFRKLCVELVDKSSFREVSEATGLSTNTLQRWKREATK